jgi:hypothetical protein
MFDRSGKSVKDQAVRMQLADMRTRVTATAQIGVSR